MSKLIAGVQEFKNIISKDKINMKPGLYIVATPIGNLEDISIRAKETLKNAEIIVCENPKHSLKLFNKLGIKKKLYSLHDHNENKIIEKIAKPSIDKTIALISDAGSPLISDPGYRLVQFYIDNKYNLTTIPGPSSLIASLQISGMAPNAFNFFGFPPKSKSKFTEFIKNLKNESRTSIFYISNHKLHLCLETIQNFLGNRMISVCKEITKINERVFRGKAREILFEIKKNKKNKLGEFVILVDGSQKHNEDLNLERPELDTQIKKLLKKYSLTDVVEIVHKLTNISKKDIYKKSLKYNK